MKILMTTYSLGGIWTYVMSLCKSLECYNTEIHLLNIGEQLTDEKMVEVALLRNVEFYEGNFNLHWENETEKDLESVNHWVNSIYEDIQPDILHINNFGLSLESFNCPIITVYHYCILTWWLSVYGKVPPFNYNKQIDAVRNTIKNSQIIVSPSADMLKQAENVNGPFQQSQVIYHGIEVNMDSKMEKEYTVLTAGRLINEAKNIKLLSNIAQYIDWPVCIAGYDNMAQSHKLNNTENVFLLGQLSNVEFQYYLDRSSIFVMPSKYEPFSMVVLEAASAGCALVLANIPALVEIWGDAALFFDPEDDNQAKLAIQLLIRDETFRNEMAEKAINRSKQFTANRMASEYYQLYDSLLIPIDQNIISASQSHRPV